MKQKGIQLHEGVPELKQQQKWFPAQGGVLILDNIISEGENDKEVLDHFSKHSHHRTSQYFTYVKTCFHPENLLRVFLVMFITL